MSEFIKVAAVAEKTGVSRQRIYTLIKEGRIPSMSIAGIVHVDMENLGNWQKGGDLRKQRAKTNIS